MDTPFDDARPLKGRMDGPNIASPEPLGEMGVKEPRLR